MANKKSERKEAFTRIIIGIISGILLYVWLYLIIILVILHLIIILFSGKRNKNITELCEYWNLESNKYLKYLTFVSNEKPFPFKIRR